MLACVHVINLIVLSYLRVAGDDALELRHQQLSAKLKEPITKERKFEDVVEDAEQAAVLVLVY